MVILSVSLLTQNGRVLLARQFVEISRMRLDGLLSAFPKLLSSENRQHTFIDTESVRYVYQPLEKFYLLIITNKSSNIVQDLQTQQLLSKLIPEICGGPLTEDNIKLKQFELIFGFDEILTPGGYSLHMNIQQIKTNLLMESHEEKLHQMIQESKQTAAKDEMKRQQIRIKEEQREKIRIERNLSANNKSSSSIGMNMNSLDNSTYQTPPTPISMVSNTPNDVKQQKIGGTTGGGGMKLGSMNKGKINLVNAMVVEDGMKNILQYNNNPTIPNNSTNQSQDNKNTPTEPIVLCLEEKLSVILNREGTLENFEIKGTLYVHASDPSKATSSVKLINSKNNNYNINYMAHPKINKKLFETDNILCLKDTSKPFPETRVGVLRWSVKNQDENYLPINITCWPEETGNNKILVTIEYTLEKPMILENVDIIIPLGKIGNGTPEIISIDEGSHFYNPATNSLLWHHNTLDHTNKTGNLEFSANAESCDSFFPLTINFISRDTYCDIDIDSVHLLQDNSSILYHYDKSLTIDSYVIH